MKKFIALFLCLCMMLMLCSCGLGAIKTPEENTPTESNTTASTEQSSETNTNNESVPEGNDKTSSDGKTSDDNKTGHINSDKEIAPNSTPITANKKYFNNKENYFSKEYRPSLILTNNTFTLVENLAEGMGEYKGTFILSGNTLTLNVTETNFGGFAGDDVRTIVFTINNTTTLTIQTDLCLTQKGDVFKID